MIYKISDGLKISVNVLAVILKAVKKMFLQNTLWDLWDKTQMMWRKSPQTTSN